MKKKPTLRILKKTAWRLWSELRRREAADFRGNLECFTCKKKFHYKTAHLGHFHHRKLDFDRINTNPQCAGCNLYKHGELGAYAERLIETHGLETVKDLRRRAAKVHKYTKEELEDIIKETKEKLDALSKR